MPLGPYFLSRDPNPTGAPLRNREPTSPPSTFTSVVDETLHITAGSVLDLSAWRATAVPAGSRGWVTASGDKLVEAGVPVRFSIATIQPEVAFTPLPASKSAIDAGCDYLARCGYNAIRLMGLEHWLMWGQYGVATFDDAKLDLFDYLLAACKARGIYWIGCVQSYNGFEDMQGSTQRFNYTEDTSTKPRMYTEAGVRANTKLGIERLYNRVNPYTGVNMMRDAALLMIEMYNEQSTTFCGSSLPNFPPRWLTRTPGSIAAAKTWGEWLQDTSASHGYANLAALNASWGTAFASYALAAADPMPLLTNSMAQTQKNIDLVRYTQYLEDDLAAAYTSWVAEWGYPGLTSTHTMYPTHQETRGTQKYAVNKVGNWHGYTNISYGLGLGVPTTDYDAPIWENERVLLSTPVVSGAKPGWWGELGAHTYARWRQHFPLMYAMAAAQGVSAVSFFTQGDFFYPAYYNDASLHGDRFRRMDNFQAPGAHINDAARVLIAALFLRGDVAEMTATQSVPANNRYNGVNPRSTGRLTRTYSTLFQPLQFFAALLKFRLVWTDDDTDDTLAAEWNLKSWKTLCDDALAAGAIAADHPSLVSATANNGTIASVATTGTVGGLTATQAEPVLDIGSNTLVDGDLIHVTNMTGSVGTWPGINSRNSRSAVLKGTGNYVQLKADATRNVSGLALTGLSGANFTAGTWCEGGNVIELGNRHAGWSRRLKRWFAAATTSPKSVVFGHTSATLPATIGPVIITTLTTDAVVAVVSADGQSIATSSRFILILLGAAINTGMTYTVGADGKQTLTAAGDYPVQQLDATATLSLGLTLPQAWRLYRLKRDGSRGSAESLTSIDASNGRINLTLRTGTIQPSPLWELVR